MNDDKIIVLQKTAQEKAQEAASSLPKMSWFIVSLGLLSALAPFAIDMYLPAFSDIEKSFSVDVEAVQHSLVSFFIGIGCGQLLCGPLSDRFGRKPIIQAGLVIFIFSSIACAVANNIFTLISWRFFQAIGCSACMVLTRATVRDRFNQNYAARVFSLLILIMSVAPILAPIIGGYLTIILGWKSVFWFLVFFSIFCLTLSFFIPETHQISLRTKNISIKSVFKTYFEIIKFPIFLGYALTGGFLQGGMFAYIAGSPFMIIDFFHVAKENFGWFFGVNAFALIITSQINSRLLEKYHYQKILQSGCVAIFILGIIMLTAFLLKAGLWQTVPLFFLYLGLLGFITPNSVAGALSSQGSRAGSASALLGTIQFTCAAIASSSVSFFHDGTPISMVATITICTLLSLLSYLILVKTNLEKL